MSADRVIVADMLGRESGARREGDAVRARALEIIERCGVVTVDLARFWAGPGFVDECFGLLVRDFGPEWFRAHVRPINLGDAEALLQHVIKRRGREFRARRAAETGAARTAQAISP